MRNRRTTEEEFCALIQSMFWFMRICEMRESKARRTISILQPQLRDHPFEGCWLLRHPPGTSFRKQLRRVCLPQQLLFFAGTSTTEYVLWVFAWWLVGRAAMEGHLDYGWLLGWGLLLLTLVPFLLLSTRFQGVLAVGGGMLLKQRLLAGSLRLQPEEIRHQGIGQFLGRVIESETVESLALSGGIELE